MSQRAAFRDGDIIARGWGLAIRLKRAEDAANDYAWNRDHELARLNQRSVTDEPYPRFVERLEQELRFVDPRQRTFAIEDGDAIHIGNVMYYGVASAGDSAEIGITIGSGAHWNRGIGRRALVLFVRHLFESTAFRVLTLHTLESNERALRCFRACGFEEIGRSAPRGAMLVELAARREYWLFDDSRGRFAFRHAGESPNVHPVDIEPSPLTPSVTA